MLVLSRRLSEKIVFPGLKTAVQVVSIKPGIVRLGVDAPPNIVVLREELQERRRSGALPLLRPTQGRGQTAAANGAASQAPQGDRGRAGCASAAARGRGC